MYYRHFGIDGPPFPLTPDTERFYPGAGRGDILLAMQHALRDGAGIIKLTGEVGSGKTMLARMLMERLADGAQIVYLANPSLERNDIHQAIALELGLRCEPGLSGVQLLDRIQKRLIEIHRQGRTTIVFIEEAQGMPVASLEEVRYLSNLETSRSRLLQIVLIGQPELDELLARRDLRQLDDRIAHGFVLPPLSMNEVHDYLAFRLRCAGHASGDLFTPAACRMLHRASGGRLRRLHVLADKALLAAYAQGASRVLPGHVRRACRDREGSRFPWAWVRMLAASVGAAGLAGFFLFGLLSPGISIGKAVPESGTVPVEQGKPETVSPEALSRAAGKESTDPAATDTGFIDRRMAALGDLAGPGERRYAIQLTVTHDRDRTALARYLSALPPEWRSRLYIYPVEIGGRARYSVVLGSFDSLGEARELLQRLPPALARYRPYVRPLAAIQLEAGLARGGNHT
ncbi:MAG TPA: general secretion pathway protein [Thiotrichales bacterium]|nr:general secretion pathway protein [Thiotrichales bacterium]